MKKIIFIIPVIVLIGCKTEDEVVKEFACDPETVTYESQVYNTVQIGDQCWLKENLNVGTMVGGFWVKMTDNGIKEKYCYNGNPDYCAIYGGLYNWNEMMQYTTQQGSQGICPSGWHLPTDEEWKVLEGSVDSQFGIGDSIWDENYYRGYDAGTSLQTNSGWYENGTDLFGFSGLPGGFRSTTLGFYFDAGHVGYWWSSTESNYDTAWFRSISNGPEVYRYIESKDYGFSVRCLRDN